MKTSRFSILWIRKLINISSRPQQLSLCSCEVKGSKSILCMTWLIKQSDMAEPSMSKKKRLQKQQRSTKQSWLECLKNWSLLMRKMRSMILNQLEISWRDSNKEDDEWRSMWPLGYCSTKEKQSYKTGEQTNKIWQLKIRHWAFQRELIKKRTLIHSRTSRNQESPLSPHK